MCPRCYNPGMIDKEISWGSERGRHFYDISATGSKMVTERIMLEGLGLRLINLPLCSESEAVYLEEFIPRAKEGFALAMKTEAISPNELYDLFHHTTPVTTSGIWRQTALTERQNTLPEYYHCLASLALLLKLGRVSFLDFTSPPPNLDSGLTKIETYWHSMRPTPGQLWQMIEELEIGIRESLYQKEPLGTRELLKVAHFFSAGKEISQIFTE